MNLLSIRHIDELRVRLDEARAQGKKICVVPTMGNLHDGHLQLVRLAHEKADVVVATIFVNQLQFGLNEDWDKYPRTFEDDRALLEAEGCHILFAPTNLEMYPNGIDNQTRVFCPTMTDVLCGASRPGHFEGVTTVVTKLFHIVEPDVAIFGKKDFQQLAIIRRMVADMCLRVDIIGAPIAREDDGLAMSSRNRFITNDERPRANQLFQTLSWIREQITQGNRDFPALEEQGKKQIANAGFRPDYLSVCNAQNLEPALDDDPDLAILGALFTSGARLIDNLTLSV